MSAVVSAAVGDCPLVPKQSGTLRTAWLRSRRKRGNRPRRPCAVLQDMRTPSAAQSSARVHLALPGAVWRCSSRTKRPRRSATVVRELELFSGKREEEALCWRHSATTSSGCDTTGNATRASRSVLALRNGAAACFRNHRSHVFRIRDQMLSDYAPDSDDWLARQAAGA